MMYDKLQSWRKNTFPRDENIPEQDRWDAQKREWNMQKAVGGLEYWHKILYG